MIIEKRNFLKGMNGDISQRLLGAGESLNLMNCRVAVTEKGRSGRVENIPGNTLIDNNVRPAFGNYQCIGSGQDLARTRILFALQNTLGYNSLYCLDILNNNKIYLVVQSADITGGLSWSRNLRIDRNMKVIGDLLYWTDYNEQPHKINIEAAIKMNDPTYSTTVTPYTSPIDSSVISLIRKPEGLVLGAAKVHDAGFGESFLDNFAGQFASRFIFRDGERSVMSTPSHQLNYKSFIDSSNVNAIDINFQLTETFEQDVQIIQLAVRYNNTPDYFVIKEWNKDNAADAAAIAAHNAGSAALTYRFYNNQSGIPIGTNDSVKPFDNIGTKVKTLEYADSRLYLANYIKGYDTPTTTSLSASASTSSSDISALTFLSNSSHQMGLRFRDRYKRASGVVTNIATCLIEIPDRDYNYSSFVTTIDWTLSNAAASTEIPDWAYYYDILITKNLRTRFFEEYVSDVMLYVFKDSTTGAFVYNSVYNSKDLFGVAIKIDLLNSRGLGYVFNEGDRCRIYMPSDKFSGGIIELNVLGQDSNYVLVKYDDDFFGGNQLVFLDSPFYFQLFTPYKILLEEPYYTIGESYLITNPTASNRTYSTLSNSISGDVFKIKKTITVPGILGTYHNFTARYAAMSPNDIYWRDWFGIYGEQNFLPPPKGQVNKQNFVSFSNVKVIGASTNGLSTFDAADEKALPEIGAIQKLQLSDKVSNLGEGQVMLAIFPTETASLYIGETQLMASSKQGDVATSTEVIGTVNVLKNSSGTIHPESVIQYLGDVFWFDALNGFFTQYSTNGLEHVSRYNMSRFFKNYAADYMATNANNLDNINGFHHIPACVDPFHKEIIVQLPALIYDNYADVLPSYSSIPSYATSILNRFDIYDKLQKTMAFQYEENKWGSNFEYTGAEWFEFIENRLFAWKNGDVYEMNTDFVNTNTFFGLQKPVRMCFTCNVNPSIIKDLINISIEGNSTPNFTVGYADYPNIQITDLANTDTDLQGNPIWTVREGIPYATFLKDRLSPNSSGTADQKLFIGDIIKDTAVKIMLEFQAYNGLIFINFVNIGFDISRGQQRILETANG